MDTKGMVKATELLGSSMSAKLAINNMICIPKWLEVLNQQQQQRLLNITSSSYNMSLGMTTLASLLPDNSLAVKACTEGLTTFKCALELSSFTPTTHLPVIQTSLLNMVSTLTLTTPKLTGVLNLKHINALECETASALKNAGFSNSMVLPSLQIAESLRNLTSLSLGTLSIIDSTLSATQLVKSYANLVQGQYTRILKDVSNSEKHFKVIELATAVVQSQIDFISTIKSDDIVENDEPLEENTGSSKSAIQYIPSYLGYAFKENTYYDLDEEYAKSIICKVLSRGKNILSKIEYINELCMATGKEVVFKPTNKMFSASASVSSSFAADETTFGNIVDSLYKLLYEGSGDAKRLTDFLTDEECATLWNVKHLRTDFRHDIEHGKEKDYLKKKKIIGEVYQKICGKVRPLKHKDWVTAHSNLFEDIETFLDLIIDKLSLQEN